MSKKAIFFQIFDIVASETEVDKDLIMSHNAKSREVVDARYMLLYFLHHKDYAGMDNMYISRMMGMTPQGVRVIVTGFNDRKEQSGKFFATTLERIRKRIEIELLT